MFQESLETWRGKTICQMKKKKKGEGRKGGRREGEGEEGREDKPCQNVYSLDSTKPDSSPAQKRQTLKTLSISSCLFSG